MKLDDLYGLQETDKLTTGIKTRYSDPRDSVYRSTMTAPTTTPIGVFAKALAGYQLGRSGAQQQQAQQALLDESFTKDADFSQKLGQILKDHEEKGYTDKHTRLVLSQMYAETKEPRYLKVANMFSSSEPKPANELKDTTSALRDYDKAMEETQGLEYDASTDPKRQAIVEAMGSALEKNYPSKNSNVNSLSDLQNLAKPGAKEAEVKLGSDIQPSPASEQLAKAGPQEGGRNDAYLSSLNPKWQQLIKGVADYDIDAKTRMGGFNKSKQAEILNAVKKFDPTFDMKEYPVRADFMKQMSKSQRGTFGGQRLALNTLIGHLGQYQHDIDRLNTGELPAINAMENFIKKVTGDEKITDLNLARLNVEAEIESLLTGVGVTQEGLAHRLALMPKNPSKRQLNSYVQRLIDTLSVRGNALEDHYRSVLKKEPENEVYFQNAKDVIKQLKEKTTQADGEAHVDNAGFEMIKHGNKTYRIPVDMVDEFKKEKGIN